MFSVVFGAGHVSVWAAVRASDSAGDLRRLCARWWRHLYGAVDEARLEQRLQPRVVSPADCCDARQGQGSDTVRSIQGALSSFLTAVSNNVTSRDIMPIERRWSPFLSQTPVYTARPRIWG